MKTYWVRLISTKAARALGEPDHVYQVHALGAFKSKAAFVRALVASGLAHTEGSALSTVTRDGGETGNTGDIEFTSAAPGQLFVRKKVKVTGDMPLAWPQES